MKELWVVLNYKKQRLLLYIQPLQKGLLFRSGQYLVNYQ